MKILILTGAFGMGHYSAAQAIKEEILLDEPYANIEIIDVVDYIFPKISKIIYRVFNFVVSKFLLMYNYFNIIASRNPSTPIKALVEKKIDILLNDKNIDMIISTFPICSQYVSAYKKIKNKNIPLFTYITDIDVNEEWICENTDMYFVGSKQTKESLIKKGVGKEKIIVCGIPVKHDFKDQAITEIRKNNKEILIMGGGLGLIPQGDKILDYLSNIENINITFIAGKNKRLIKQIKESYPNINVLGYCDNVYDYMKKADLLITKSGGITLFEAIHSTTPLYVIRPFLCQEIGNAKFIQEHRIGKVIWTRGTDIYEDLTFLLENDILLDDMKKNIKNIRENLDNSSPLAYYNKSLNLCYYNVSNSYIKISGI